MDNILNEDFSFMEEEYPVDFEGVDYFGGPGQFCDTYPVVIISHPCCNHFLLFRTLFSSRCQDW